MDFILKTVPEVVWVSLIGIQRLKYSVGRIQILFELIPVCLAKDITFPLRLEWVTY